MRLHLHFSTLRCGQQGWRVMQILICLTGKLVKFPCFSAINPQITCTLPPSFQTPSLPVHTFVYGDLRDRSHRAKLTTTASREKKTIEITLSCATRDQEGVNTPAGPIRNNPRGGQILIFPRVTISLARYRPASTERMINQRAALNARVSATVVQSMVIRYTYM